MEKSRFLRLERYRAGKARLDDLRFGQKEVAIFRQQNKIPKGRLSGRWGTIAFDIVLAMRGQILEAMLFETSGNDSRRFHPTSNSPYLNNFGPDRRRLQDVTPLL